MSLTYAERERLNDTALRIQRVREIAANMKHTVELSGAELRIARRALALFANGPHGGRVTVEEAMDASDLQERLSSVEVPDLARV